jgi:hypothetical protein
MRTTGDGPAFSGLWSRPHSGARNADIIRLKGVGKSNRDAKRGFHVKIGGSEGNRQTILGFGTEGAADAWIADDKRLTDHTAPWNLTGPVARRESRSQQIEAHCAAVARA